MSSGATPITPERFAEAIKELPLANLQFKAAEICNSIAHLVSSNQQLQPFVDEGDSDCIDAIQENLVVIQRMEERILLLKGEVEGRGSRWGDERTKPERVGSNGLCSTQEVRVASQATHGRSSRLSSGQLGDEELARSVREQMEEGDDNETQNGMHL